VHGRGDARLDGTMFDGWLDRFRDFRNRRIADPAFRRWAARFPLTRPIARRQARALFDLTAGFVYSQVLAACVRVDLFELLARGPLAIDQIVLSTGLNRDGAERLVKAAVALRLVEARAGGRFAVGPLGAAMVGNPGVSAMIAHHDILYRDLADPVALLKGEAKARLQQYWAYAGGSARAAPPASAHADYTALMAASQAFVTAELLDAYRFEGHKRLLDVGGGDGTFAIAAARAAPGLEVMLFDLPPVSAIARQRILAAGLSGRARAHGGSFFTDPLPAGADVVTLNRVLHDHDDDAALAILVAIRRAIAKDGTLLVTEPMAGTPGAEASGDAYFGFYLLAMGQGRPRRREEIETLLSRAGFSRFRTIPTNTPLIARIIAARPD
jgi:demethylspheroidene O-methyltransferase